LLIGESHVSHEKAIGHALACDLAVSGRAAAIDAKMSLEADKVADLNRAMMHNAAMQAYSQRQSDGIVDQMNRPADLQPTMVAIWAASRGGRSIAIEPVQ
jgi:hypothetical protein